MTDINLLKDRGIEDEEKEKKQEQEKQKLVVELTNPSKERQKETTKKPGGFWTFLKELFTGLRKPKPEGAGKVRILHEERTRPEKEKPKPAPKRIIEERYVSPQPEGEAGLEDVFAPSPKAEKEETAPVHPSSVARDEGTASTVLPSEDFRGAVTTPPPLPTPPEPAKAGQPGPEAKRAAQPVPQAEGKPQTSDSDTFLGVNLVPEELMAGGARQNRIVALVFTALISALIVAVVYVGLSIFENRIVDETRAKRETMAELDRTIQRHKETKQKAAEFHSVTDQALNLLDTHIYWTKFFGGLEKYIVETVFVRGFSADQAGHLALSLSAKDFRSVAQQLIAFEAADDFVSDVSITAAGVNTTETASTVDFTATITLQPDVFYRDSTGGPTYTIK